jgi:hypothetical protein
MKRSYALSHRVHAIIELDVRLATPADDHVTEPGLLEPDGIGELASGTIDFHLELVEIDLSLDSCFDSEHELFPLVTSSSLVAADSS